MRLWHFISICAFFLLLFLEEEAEEEDPYKNLPKNEDELDEWASKFHERHHGYPLYGIVLARKEDSEAIKFIQKSHKALAVISGRDCCFIYFKREKKGSLLELITKPFSRKEESAYEEDQAEWVPQIARLLNIRYDHLPSFLFFEQITSGKFAYLSLRGASASEILDIAGEVFHFMNNERRPVSLDNLSNFILWYNVRHNVKKIGQSIGGVIVVGKDAWIELIRIVAQVLFHQSSSG